MYGVRSSGVVGAGSSGTSAPHPVLAGCSALMSDSSPGSVRELGATIIPGCTSSDITWLRRAQLRYAPGTASAECVVGCGSGVAELAFSTYLE